MCNTLCYIDILRGFIKDYNHSFHRAIRARPVDVIPLNSEGLENQIQGLI